MFTGPSCNQPQVPVIERASFPWGFTLFGSLALMIHTHWELLSYWMGKLGEVKVPEGPCRLLPHVFTVNNTAHRGSVSTAVAKHRYHQH